MSDATAPYKNKLLSALPADVLAKLQPCLEWVPLRPRQVLHWRGRPVEYAYFVEEGLVSVVASTDEKTSVEVWLLGCEGLAGGTPVVLGGRTSPHRRVVLVGGHAWRIRSDDLLRMVDENPTLRRHLLRYALAVLIQTSQSGACAGRHTVHQRLARWLLLAHDRVSGDALPLTHALLSRLLGVRRATITVAIGELESAGIVRQGWGSITLLDRRRLEAASCGCYRIIAAGYDEIGDT